MICQYMITLSTIGLFLWKKRDYLPGDVNECNMKKNTVYRTLLNKEVAMGVKRWCSVNLQRTMLFQET